MTPSPTKPHNFKTRLFHSVIAILVVSQVVTSQFMTKPGESLKEDILFEVHEYTGVAVFFLILAFWIFVYFRDRGTEPATLFPWFWKKKRMALWADTKVHLAALSKFKVPEHVRGAALPSAVHGLGILLITLMATTGIGWWIAIKLGDVATAWGETSRQVHEITSKLVWAYLIGHVGFALINQFAGKQPLTDMWSLKK